MKARGVGQRRRIMGYKAAWRVGREARRRAVVGVVASMASQRRRTVYCDQNLARGAGNTGPDGLTPRQRRRLTHKENAAR